MWISRAEYNELKSFREKYNGAKMVDDFSDTYIESLLWQINAQKKEKIKYREQCEEYKRKYADEVNKRLELIKFYERQDAN